MQAEQTVELEQPFLGAGRRERERPPQRGITRLAIGRDGCEAIECAAQNHEHEAAIGLAGACHVGQRSDERQPRAVGQKLSAVHAAPYLL